MEAALFNRGAVNDVMAQHEHLRLSTRIMAKSVRKRHKIHLSAESQREVELTRLWQKIEALEGAQSLSAPDVKRTRPPAALTSEDHKRRVESLALSELEHRRELQNLFVKLDVLNEAILIVHHHNCIRPGRKRRPRHSR